MPADAEAPPPPGPQNLLISSVQIRAGLSVVSRNAITSKRCSHPG